LEALEIAGSGNLQQRPVCRSFTEIWTSVEKEKIMTRNQQIGVWLLCSLLLALALYRWFNLH